MGKVKSLFCDIHRELGLSEGILSIRDSKWTSIKLSLYNNLNGILSKGLASRKCNSIANS